MKTVLIITGALVFVIILLKDGEEVNRFIGMRIKDFLIREAQKYREADRMPVL